MAGTRTLKEAVNEALRDWAASVRNTHYIIGSVVGPHPFPVLVRDLQRVIGDEARAQYAERLGGDPDVVVACVGGGSNAIGMFTAFVGAGRHPADRRRGGRARLAARRTLLVAHAGPAGHLARRPQLPAPGRRRSGRRHAFDLGRARLSGRRSRARVPPGRAGSRDYVSATDAQALEGFQALAQNRGHPACARAVARHRMAVRRGRCPAGSKVLVCLSGRGDKDLDTIRAALDAKDA